MSGGFLLGRLFLLNNAVERDSDLRGEVMKTGGAAQSPSVLVVGVEILEAPSRADLAETEGKSGDEQDVHIFGDTGIRNDQLRLVFGFLADTRDTNGTRPSVFDLLHAGRSNQAEAGIINQEVDFSGGAVFAGFVEYEVSGKPVFLAVVGVIDHKQTVTVAEIVVHAKHNGCFGVTHNSVVETVLGEEIVGVKCPEVDLTCGG